LSETDYCLLVTKISFRLFLSRHCQRSHQGKYGKCSRFSCCSSVKCFSCRARSFKQRLGDISEQDVQKENFKTRIEFMQAWNTINGSWNPDAIVTVYEFILVEKDNEKAIR
jgi:hypothetical protein